MNTDYSREIPEKWKMMAKVFEAMGNEHRQRILLTFEKGEELSIKELVEVSTLKRTSVVHHLQILENAGVLVPIKKGKFVYYHINPDIVIEACNGLISYANKMN